MKKFLFDYLKTVLNKFTIISYEYIYAEEYADSEWSIFYFWQNLSYLQILGKIFEHTLQISAKMLYFYKIKDKKINWFDMRKIFSTIRLHFVWGKIIMINDTGYIKYVRFSWDIKHYMKHILHSANLGLMCW